MKFSKILVFGFFLTYLIVGLFIFRKYGVCYDEEIQRSHGMTNAIHIASKLYPSIIPNDPIIQQGLKTGGLNAYRDRDHGMIFALPMVIVEKAMGWSNETQKLKIYTFWHFSLFIITFLSLIAFFKILKKRFQHDGWAILGCLLYITSPRLFAESFYNANDIPLVVLGVFSAFFTFRYITKKNYLDAFLSGLFIALAIDMRLIGVMFFGLWGLMVLIDYIKQFQENKSFRMNELKYETVFILSLILCIVIFYPYLWENPLGNFIEAFQKLTHYKYNGSTFYNGVFYASTLEKEAKLPWHYLPVWIGITTPLIHLIGFLLGTVLFVVHIKKASLIDIYFFVLFYLVVAVILILNQTLYDGWRHVYFIYPSLIYLTIFGFWQFSKSFSVQYIKYYVGIILLSLAGIIGWMAMNHPYQNIYFNSLAGKNIEKRFDVDYWGLSYREGLNWIMENDKSPKIKVFINGNAAAMANLKTEDYLRTERVGNPQEADYFLTEYRYHPEDYQEYAGKEVYSIHRDGLRLLSIFKLK